jgi:hypothetical protein
VYLLGFAVGKAKAATISSVSRFWFAIQHVVVVLYDVLVETNRKPND